MTTLNSSTDLEQRSGRIIRQGNENEDVYIYRYVTEDAFDSYLWQTIENKQKFISQIMTSKSPVRAIQDMDEATLNYAEIKALATGNPLIKEKMDLDVKLTKLTMLKQNYNSNKYSLEDKIIHEYPDKITRFEINIGKISKDIEYVNGTKTSEEKFMGIRIGNEFYKDKKEASQKLISAIKRIDINQSKTHIGEYKGFDIYTGFNMFYKRFDFTLKREEEYIGSFGEDAIGNITRLDNTIEKISKELEQSNLVLDEARKSLEKAKEEVKRPFEKEEELRNTIMRLNEINYLLNEEQTRDAKSYTKEEIEILKNISEEIKKEVIFDFEFLKEIDGQNFKEAKKLTDKRIDKEILKHQNNVQINHLLSEQYVKSLKEDIKYAVCEKERVREYVKEAVDYLFKANETELKHIREYISLKDIKDNSLKEYFLENNEIFDEVVEDIKDNIQRKKDISIQKVKDISFDGLEM